MAAVCADYSFRNPLESRKPKTIDPERGLG